MIKRTPQEIADFFGCYVAQDDKGAWYAYANKPDMIPATDHVRGYWNSVDDSCSCLLYECLFVPENHDWTELYEPQGKEGKTSGKFPCSDNKSKDCYSDQAVSENKPAHLGEVYTHKEYRIVTAHKEIDSESFAKGVMAWVERGWIPTGGISFDKQGCPYQAMVRGV